MQTSSREQNDYHHGPNKDNKETRINCLSDTASTTSSSILGRFANSGIKTFERLSCQSTFRRGCKRRTFLVDREFKPLKWKVPIFASNRLVHIVGCINQEVGRHMPEDINRRNLVTGGTEGSHQHTRTEGSAFSHIDFYKIQNTSEDTCLDGQQSSFELPGKDGEGGRGGALTTSTLLVSLSMGLSAVKKDRNYCRVPTRSSECDSRLGVRQFSGQE